MKIAISALFLGTIGLAFACARPEPGESNVPIGAVRAVSWPSSPKIEEAPAYTAAQVRGFHEEFTIDNWDDGGPLMRYVFLNMGEFFHESVIHRRGPISPLTYRLDEEIGAFETSSRLGQMSLAEYIHEAAVDGLVIVSHGEIVFEAYPRMRGLAKHLLMSVSKGYASTLVAILEERGLVDSSAPLEQYLPELVGSGWEGVPVVDVLDMASGIDCFEGVEDAYTNPKRCYYQYEASLGWLGATRATRDSPYEFLASLQSHRPSGEAYEYTSPNTFILSWLIERVLDKSYAEALSEEIWQKIGTESDGLISAPRHGIAIAHGGISATLRDVARFGLLFTPSWEIVASNPIVSKAYAEQIRSGGRPEIQQRGIHTVAERLRVDGEMPRHNTYQWDFVMQDGDFFKGGYGGQGLYISPRLDLVIAYFGSFEMRGPSNQLRDISRQLAKSGLFD